MFTATNIQTPDELFARITSIQAFLEAEFNSDIPAACVERAQELASLMAQTGKMLADAKWHYNQLVGNSILAALKMEAENRMSISTLNKYVESLTKDYSYLVNWIERSNRAITHQIELLRSLISKHKTEYENSKWQK